MNKKLLLTLAALAVTAAAQAQVTYIDDGDFSSLQSKNSIDPSVDGTGIWYAGNAVVESTGGNPDAFLKIAGSWGQTVYVALPTPTAADTWTMTLDVIAASGTQDPKFNVAGVKAGASYQWGDNADGVNIFDIYKVGSSQGIDVTNDGTWQSVTSSAWWQSNLNVDPTQYDYVVFALNFNGGATPALTGMDNFKVEGTQPIPEPATYAGLAGVAALGLAILRRRRK